MRISKRLKIICIILTIVVAINIPVSIQLMASDIEWSYDSQNKTLYISGTGKMDDYEDEFSMPWIDYISEIQKVVLDDNITYIGDYSFCGAKQLLDINMPKSLTGLGDFALASCPKVKKLTLNSQVTEIPDVSFAYDGIAKKSDFVIYTELGSYALQVAVDSSLNYECEYIKSSTQYPVNFTVDNMVAYYPYYAKSDGTFAFYSSGIRNTYGYVYDENLKCLAYNEDNGSDMNFRMEVELEKGNLYYLAVKVHGYKYSNGITVGVEPVSFTATGSVRAMLNTDGEPSNIGIPNATVDDIEIGSEFSFVVTSENATKTFVYNGQIKEITLSPDEENIVVFMVCDVNSDGFVNAKDYAIMKKNSSPYIDLFKNFINYSY